MDMDFLTFPRRGRPQSELVAAVVRELTAEDLPLLENSPKQPIHAHKRLSERHRKLARKIASGMKTEDAAHECGYTYGTVRILKTNPAFVELIEFFRRNEDETARNLNERLAEIATNAAEEILERLEEKPEELAMGTLVELTKMGADRTGHGPSSTQNLNINDGLAERLRLARERVKASRMIEGEAKRISG